MNSAAKVSIQFEERQRERRDTTLDQKNMDTRQRQIDRFCCSVIVLFVCLFVQLGDEGDAREGERRTRKI